MAHLLSKVHQVVHLVLCAVRAQWGVERKKGRSERGGGVAAATRAATIICDITCFHLMRDIVYQLT